MGNKIKIGISSCLLGKQVRYDGGHKLDHFLTDTLGQYVDWVPVCPEVECGLPVPREAMHLIGEPETPRLVTHKTGIDHTQKMEKWASKKLKALGKEDLCGFIFKSRSPSSGMSGVKIYSESGVPGKKGRGIFAGAFIKEFPLIPVEDEGRLNDPGLRENFIERIFVFMRWNKFLKNKPTTKSLIEFHADHKLLIMSHSVQHVRELGKLVAGAKGSNPQRLYAEYFQILMDGLKLQATVKKNVNVLHHIMGYFKNLLSTDEKQELLEVIEQYHTSLTPIIVPVTLLKHYVRKYNEPYLVRQHYLNPHPVDLMLRNHV